MLIQKNTFDPFNSIHLLLDFSNKTLRREAKQYVHSCWGECAYCGDKENLTIDHIHPQTHGGTNDIHNLVSACSKCNVSKSNKELWDWYYSRSYFSWERWDKIQEWQKYWRFG